MTVELIAVGKTDSQHVEALVEMYMRRINRYVKFAVTTIPDVRQGAKQAVVSQMRREGEALLRLLTAEDYVVLLDDSGELRVNGTLHTGEIPYATYPAEGLTYPYTVPEGCLFLLCDHRTQGRDSRHFGAVPEDSVAGKVITLLRRRGL